MMSLSYVVKGDLQGTYVNKRQGMGAKCKKDFMYVCICVCVYILMYIKMYVIYMYIELA